MKSLVANANAPLTDAEMYSALRSRRLFKSLSLLEAQLDGLPAAPTLVLIKPNYRVLRKWVKDWMPENALMVRIDYSSLPKSQTAWRRSTLFAARCKWHRTFISITFSQITRCAKRRHQ